MFSQTRLRKAAKKAITKMPTKTLKADDKVKANCDRLHVHVKGRC